MFRNNVYSLNAPGTVIDGRLRTTIRFNADHPIFRGHFPGFPVVPGVCMMAIVKELLEENLHTTLHLKTVSQVKFLSLVNPNEQNEVVVEISHSRLDDGGLQVEAVIYVGTNPYFKMSRAVYR